MIRETKAGCGCREVYDGSVVTRFWCSLHDPYCPGTGATASVPIFGPKGWEGDCPACGLRTPIDHVTRTLVPHKS